MPVRRKRGKVMANGLLQVGRRLAKMPVGSKAKSFGEFEHRQESRFVSSPEFVLVEQVEFVANLQIGNERFDVFIPLLFFNLLVRDDKPLMLKTHEAVEIDARW